MIITQAQLEWVKPPQQTRSQQTFERLLDAAEAIIDEKGLEHATVAEIAKRANSSVGSFYSRFSDKEGLMRCVFERFTSQAIATTEAALSSERWHGVAIIDALETMIAFMLSVFNEKRALVSALNIRAAHDPSVSAFGQRFQHTISERTTQLFKERGEVLDHPDPGVGVFVAVGLCLSSIEARTIHGPNQNERLSDNVLCHELVRMCVRYLGLGDRLADHDHVASQAAPPIN